MLQPRCRKYRKEQKGRNTGTATRGNAVSFDRSGLKTMGRGRLTAHQIESACCAMTRHIKRGGRIRIRIFPDKPISKKPAEVRMDNGKGNPEYYVAEIQPGKMLYEMDGVDEELAREASRLAAAKLLTATSLVVRRVGTQGAHTVKASELRDKDVAGLNQELSELLKAQFGLCIQKVTQQLQNTSQLKKVRHGIARACTALGQKGNQK